MEKTEKAGTDFITMRKFHNLIKRSMYNKYTKNTSRLLELAVGKSGDLDKWYKNKIKYIAGYDISKESIDNSKRRIKEYKKNKQHFPKIELHVKDLSKSILTFKNKFNVIVCNFAFHYFFETKDSFSNIIHTIRDNLHKGGIFMGCFFDDKQVKIHLNRSHKNSFSLEKIGKWNRSLFGNKLSVYLPDSVLNTPTIEYIIDFDLFVMFMESIGFKLIETFLFKDFHNKKYNFVDKLSRDEKEFSFLNRYFIFKLVV